ncbi:MAG TPA: aminotransferase class I/II-fold pyridoxal phosphate-dependent enzyme [Acidimicrobiia bacterium]|nr:aminotransferase class I/II-fold pyridoxal phosphate-dependent enzyme [Acidimicrobiia bacterium]
MSARRLAPFGVTVFTEMTALANQLGAVNLGQGFPDWDGPDFAKQAAVDSLQAGGTDQYPPSAGIPTLREAIARRYSPLLGRELDPDTEITVTGGCTEALAASFLGLIDPEDEVVLIEPYFDSYPVGVALAGARPRFLTLRPPDFALDLDALERLVTPATRVLVVNTPHNPTGRVFSRDEMAAIARLCVENDVLAISDEVYEEIYFEGEHLHLATLPGMAERTVTLSSVGKTYSLTGWKVGWAIAPPELTHGIRSAHQYLTFTTPTPVQHGAVGALGAPADYYSELRTSYLKRRDLLVEGLVGAGFEVRPPQGTYFVMADYRELADLDDRAFALQLIHEAGVAAVPPSAFYHDPGSAQRLLRFAFCKEPAVLEEAVERLQRYLT